MEKVVYLPEFSEELKHELSTLLAVWHSEVKELLPALEPNVQVNFNNNWLIPNTGIGGFALSSVELELAFDPHYSGNKLQQLHDLRGSYYHECYHTVQGFTGLDEDLTISALENSIYEGAATKFEMVRANTEPGWGKYPNREQCVAWLENIKQLGTEYDWNKWKFYDTETDSPWILYRTGVFVVDEVLNVNPQLSIEDIVSMPANNIYRLSGLQP